MLKVREYQTAEPAKQYRKRLRLQGFRFHGSGAYAHVYYNYKLDPSKVMKVGIISEDPAEDGWLQYAIESTRSRGNPWLPKIEQIRICKYDEATAEREGDWGYYVAKMERLHKLNQDRGTRIAREIGAAISLINGDGGMLDDDEINIPHFSALPLNAEVKVTGNKHLLEAIHLISHIVEDSYDIYFETDLHHQNIMKRDNGQLVIIDPVQ
jgi:hypothetical protein